MTSGRYALIISNSDYQDQRLTRLTTPAADAAGLRAVLEDPTICAFDDVILFENQPSYQVRIALAQFFAGRKRDDLLLLYFSGHGLLDANNRFYLALQDSNSDYISATSVAAQYVSEQMDNSRARRQIVILDCCHSGAFAAGSKKGGQSVGTGNAFDQNGYGRFILTATDHLQYAWEGDKLEGKYERSLFTHHLVEGLRTGAADLDRQGHITIENLYQYAHDKVRADGDETRRQTPMRWVDKQKGDLIIAQTIAAKTKTSVHPKAIRIGQLRRFLSDQFELDDLYDICLDLHIDERSLGDDKSAIERELLKRIGESGRWDDLLDALWHYYQQPFTQTFGSRQAVTVMATRPRQPQPTVGVVTPKPKATAPPSIHGIEWIEIPPGEFWMGAAEHDNDAHPHEKPGHKFYLPTYWIAKTPITQTQYLPFVQANSEYEVPFENDEWAHPYNWDQNKRTFPQDKKDHPVVLVSWLDTIAYTSWLSNELKWSVMLPSEAEWEKAARGIKDQRIYPWGDNFQEEHCNYEDAGIQESTPVARYLEGASPYGLLDMSGNVWEWTRSIWGTDFSEPHFGYPYRSGDGRESLNDTESLRVVRGGSWLNEAWFMRLSYRWGSGIVGKRSPRYGFRVVVRRSSSK